MAFSTPQVSTVTQVSIHTALFVNQISLAFFVIVSKHSFDHISPVVFAALRLLLCTLSLLPVVYIIDRNFIYEYRKHIIAKSYKDKILQRIPNKHDFLVFAMNGFTLMANQTVSMHYNL
jgi:hypothetical protein